MPCREPKPWNITPGEEEASVPRPMQLVCLFTVNGNEKIERTIRNSEEIISHLREKNRFRSAQWVKRNLCAYLWINHSLLIMRAAEIRMTVSIGRWDVVWRTRVQFFPHIFSSLIWISHLSRQDREKKKTLQKTEFWVALLRRVLPLMDILACRSEENSYNILPSAATMLFHGLPGGDVHGVVEEMDRRGKSESAAISSAIDMGESETVGEIHLALSAC